MPIDDEFDDERPQASGPLPPEDRLWRHPSEISGAATPPPTWFQPQAARPEARRRPGIGALAAACLLGAAVASVVFWIDRPTRVVERAGLAARYGPDTRPPVTFTADASATESLAIRLADDLTRVRVRGPNGWVNGSAIWLRAEDAVIVAATLVLQAEQILVTDAGGTDRRARIAGIDTATGVAVLRLPAGAPSGSPQLSSTEVDSHNGTAAAVIGAPDPTAGADNGRATVSAVIVRAAGLRTTVAGLVLQDALQLDRPVAPDAIGGALVDSTGRFMGLVVGNAAQRLTGAVIPADTVRAVAQSLLRTGSVTRGRLGVQATDLDPAVAAMRALAGGALVTQVTPASAAARAGIRVGDVITRVDTTDVDDATDLVVHLRTRRPGEAVVVRLQHQGGGSEDLRITLGR